MIPALSALGVGSFKALLLLAIAAAITAVLQRGPARIRVVVWATALAGSLLIPTVAPLLPRVELPVLPRSVNAFRPPIGESAAVESPALASLDALETASWLQPTSRGPSDPTRPADWPVLIGLVWASGACLVLSRLGLGLWRVRRDLGDAAPIDDTSWLDDLEWACRRAGLRRGVRLVTSRQIDIPATTGVYRPTIIVPRVATSWSFERRRAVLLHEIVHIVRLDWPLRVVARLARGIYWFNPLAWWAVRRLDLEQELACDEEVVALGTRPSVYACHLLGIARAVTRHPAPAVSGLEMARACHLEERIMAILERTTPRTIGTRVLAPAALLIAALVPALAAVAPINAPDRAAPPPAETPDQPEPTTPIAPVPPTDLTAILEEMHELEAQLEPHLAAIEALEVEMAPELEQIPQINIRIDDEKLAEFEAAMQPYLERIKDIELDMAPIEAEMAEVERRLKNVELHLDDGTLADIERQISEQLEPLHEELEQLHTSMGPQLEQIEAIQREMEPIHQQLAAVHEQIEPQREELERIHAAMEPFHERMESIQREMEPIHEEMQRLGRRLEGALAGEVVDVLRQHLGAVTGPQAPLDEAAARLLEDAHIDVRDTVVRIRVSTGEARQILSDLLGPHRIGSQQAFDDAVASAADAIASLEIPAR